MKELQEKREMAEAINFEKYPVLAFDLANEIELGGKVCGYTGCKVRVKIPGEKYYVKAEMKWFEDTKKITFTSDGIMITNGMSYSELKEMVEYANAPIIEPNQEVVIVFFNSKERSWSNPIIARTSEKASKFTMTALEIVGKINLE